jgi:hypothetical protein
MLLTPYIVRSWTSLGRHGRAGTVIMVECSTHSTSVQSPVSVVQLSVISLSFLVVFSFSGHSLAPRLSPSRNGKQSNPFLPTRPKTPFLLVLAASLPRDHQTDQNCLERSRDPAGGRNTAKRGGGRRGRIHRRLKPRRLRRQRPQPRGGAARRPPLVLARDGTKMVNSQSLARYP